MILELALATALATTGIALAACIARSKRETRASRARFDAMSEQLETELTRAREDRQRLLDGLGDAFLLVDTSLHVRFANSAALTLFGKPSLANRPVAEVLNHPDFTDSVAESIATGQRVQNKLILSQQTSPLGAREKRGTNAWLIDAAPLPGDDPATRVIIRDVTLEHQTEQIRRDFVANASHELRTPMAIINGYLENLLDDDMICETETARHFLAVMRKHATRISRIIEDMLVISRLESGEAAALNIEPFPLRSCVNDVLERLEPLIRQREADVRIAMDAPGPTLVGDRFYWTQVLFNLVENALKENPHPGLRIEIGASQDQTNQSIWVADNGIGIPSSALPHIFRRFYRVDKNHARKDITGTGLGLSIVKRAVEAHHGTISVTSTPGHETRFLITLPLDQ